MAVNSVQSLYNYYSEQLERTPSLEDIKATNKMLEKVEGEERKESVDLGADHGSIKKENSSLLKREPTVVPVS